MYTRFFGFHEKPFQLVPNPAYLYLSRSHEEALAHLAYAVDHGDGFVAVTGEVGTGKTTLCRAFLENLDAGVTAAYIFNPKLNGVQLLQSINAEFNLPATATQIKDLIDILNTFLMAQKKGGRRVVIVIDEAQNLTHDVLEQLRLISNLETTQSKLLQIVLVGQPELDSLLKSGDMRQLSQRINLRAQIRPLSGQEIPAYIQHRLEVASGGDPLARFQPGALSLIARVTGGTPRLINILCDRTLLAAYGHNQFIISGAMVRSSYRELVQQGYHGFARPRPTWVPAVVVGVVVVVILAGMAPGRRLLSQWRQAGADGTTHPAPMVAPPAAKSSGPAENPISPPPKPSTQATGSKAQARELSPRPSLATAATAPRNAPEIAAQPELPGREWSAYWTQAPHLLSRDEALELVLARWREAPRHPPDLGKIDSTYAYFRVASHQNGLKLTHFSAQGSLLATLDLPAILSLNPRPPGAPGFLVLSALVDGQPILSDGQSLIRATWEQLAPYWRGTVFLPWENYLGYGDVISEESAPETILNLKLHLRDIGFTTIDLTPVYDTETRARVEELQTAHNLPVDGVVGPLTKMVLYNLDPKWPTPRLSKGQIPEETR